jgi:acyl carrier protein
MAQVAGVRSKVRAFISEAFFAEGFSDEESFLRSGIIDSMGMSELVAFLEQEYAIRVQDDELIPANLDSVALAAAFVERKLGRTAA